MKMNVFLVLSCLVLVAMEHFPGTAHMVLDNTLSTNHVVVSNALSQSLDARAPPVVIVELPKVKKNKRTKKQKKNKIRRRPPPPANCVALGSSCKSSSAVCCDFCAFCQCRLFRTVCYCRMGNPRCGW
uniref:Agouti-signaling protein n=1 Tax=Neogobius melanostomus TaxID=47308 RepID=A0A8C6TCL6_9GOBI